jgi:hypothetical protein
VILLRNDRVEHGHLHAGLLDRDGASADDRNRCHDRGGLVDHRGGMIAADRGQLRRGLLGLRGERAPARNLLTRLPAAQESWKREEGRGP